MMVRDVQCIFPLLLQNKQNDTPHLSFSKISFNFYTYTSNKTNGLKQDSQSRLRLPFPGEENLSFINNITSHRYHCQIVTTMYNTFTPILH
jgi:hypothetical protein